MRRFFAPNLGTGGRVVRAVGGVLLVLAGLIVREYSLVVCVALGIAGGFVLFEAFRGWCLMRACGIKTRL